MSEMFENSNEAAFLSILMREPDKAYDALGKIQTHMFSSAIHSEIYHAIAECARGGVDPVAENVILLLNNKKTIDKAGGDAHIRHIANEIKSDASGFQMLFQAIVDAYKGRKLLEWSSQIPTRVHGTTDISQTINAILSNLTNIQSENLENGVQPIDEALSSAYEVIEKRKDDKLPAGILTGFPTIDQYTGGYTEGTTWIISGRPSMGKTTVALTSLKEVAKAEYPCMLFNREMNSDELMFRLLSMETGIHYQKIRTSNLTQTDMKKLKTSVNKLGKIPFYLDSNYYGDIHYIISAIRKYHKLHGIRVIGIDYIQLLTDRQKDQVAELGRISRELKLLSMDLGLTILILSQLNRKAEEREDKRPIMSDLRASGNLEEDADIVLGLYRDEMYNMDPSKAGKIEFLLLKQRNGPLGKHVFNFNGSALQIIDDADADFNFGREKDG
jgi:replicative DNA helicase